MPFPLPPYAFGNPAAMVSGYDADAADFFTRASITDGTQKSAVNQLVLDLKAASLWTLISAFYPFVGAAATPHSHNLKSSSFQITWSGTVTHDVNGITGDAATGWGDTGWASSVNASLDSVHDYCYCRTTTPTDIGRFLSAANTAGTSRIGLVRSGTTLGIDGIHNPSTNLSAIGVSTDFRGSLCASRTASDVTKIYARTITPTTDANVSVGTCVQPVGILARSFQSFGPDSFTNANLAAVSLGVGLSDANYTALNTAVIAFQTALSRNV